ncbi:Na+/H+ antiporter NhaC family protein [Phaeodactylibacter sp.]|uniref:YfcC family protein n=1 Tax=Phaeodactylibacter sp. TaxID=1940289 RepID=UPI0025E7C417|nr:Na+/H+ antiporter NhaC family protein [Phaeodactylibacter sp.]MCI4650300.1 AbgT family transporter [Phaeodactylibacter sp.]MCI5091136.1 AbgT family transporter [Phaeodactylibacter sp.]
MKKFPDTLLIIFGIMIVFIGLTWLVPAGEFERTVINGREVLVPGSYERVEPNPQGLGALLQGPVRGFISAAQIIAFVFLVGGAFGIITRTGAIDAGLQSIIQFSERHPKYRHWILPVVITLFSLAGATFGMSEEVLVFVLITIPLALALGYDSITGIAVSFVGAGLGFAGAFINPFTIGVAQGIAELPPASGMGYRLVVWAVTTAIGIVYIMRYVLKLEKDPTLSPVYELDQQRDLGQLGKTKNQEFTQGHRYVLLALTAALLLLVYGVGQWGWYINEIAGLFIGLGIVAGMISHLGLEESVAAFKDGAKDMLTAALVIAMAKGLIVIAEDGKIIDTLLHTIAGLSEGLPKAVTVEIMFIFQTLLNFFVPSGSGQAALTMPIMAPLSDLLGISRQTAVLAFQFGDGLSNLIIPTSGVTMGVLAIAKIPYNVWVKWFLPLFLILCAACMLMLLPPVLFFEWA